MKIIPESERKTGNVHQGFKAIDILVHQVYNNNNNNNNTFIYIALFLFLTNSALQDIYN